MSASNFLYRQLQRWKYHTANNSFDKQVAEINRYNKIIDVDTSTFRILGCELRFITAEHAFIIERLELFLSLLQSGGYFQIEGKNLLFVINDVQLRISTAEEIFIVHEVFIEGCYKIQVDTRFSVVDIGMNVGFASLFFANNSSVNKVIGFEPFKPTYRDAQFNFSLNPLTSTKITPHAFGLARDNRTMLMKYSPVLRGKNSIHAGVGGEAIELRSAAEVFKQISKDYAPEQFFVKMDCEGAEFEIFDSFRSTSIDDLIFGFIIEWHQRNPRPIVDILLKNKFKVHQRGNRSIGLITAFR